VHESSWEGGGVAPLVLTCDTRWRSVVRFTPNCFNHGERARITHWI